MLTPPSKIVTVTPKVENGKDALGLKNEEDAPMLSPPEATSNTPSVDADETMNLIGKLDGTVAVHDNSSISLPSVDDEDDFSSDEKADEKKEGKKADEVDEEKNEEVIQNAEVAAETTTTTTMTRMKSMKKGVKKVFKLNPLSKLSSVKNKITTKLSREPSVGSVSISQSLSQTASHTPPNGQSPLKQPSRLNALDASKLSSRSGSVTSTHSHSQSQSQTHSGSRSVSQTESFVSRTNSKFGAVSSINSESEYITPRSRESQSSFNSLASTEWDSKNMKQWSKAKTKQVLFRCTRHGRYKEVRNMLEKGINPNTIDEYGNTILLVAAQNGSKRLVKTALRYNGNIDHQNYRGNTAAHYAFAYGYQTLAEYILSKGADDRLKNELGLRCYQGISTVQTGVKIKGSDYEKEQLSSPKLQSIKKQHRKTD